MAMRHPEPEPAAKDGRMPLYLASQSFRHLRR